MRIKIRIANNRMTARITPETKTDRERLAAAIRAGLGIKPERNDQAKGEAEK